MRMLSRESDSLRSSPPPCEPLALLPLAVMQSPSPSVQPVTPIPHGPVRPSLGPRKTPLPSLPFRMVERRSCRCNRPAFPHRGSGAAARAVRKRTHLFRTLSSDGRRENIFVLDLHKRSKTLSKLSGKSLTIAVQVVGAL